MLLFYTLIHFKNLPTKFHVTKTTSFVPLPSFEVPQGKTEINEKIGWFFSHMKKIRYLSQEIRLFIV